MANESNTDKATELKNILAAYEQEDKRVEEAHNAVRESEAARSAIVEQIAACVAPKKNFRWQGKDITIVARPHKVGGGMTYFLRGKSAKKDDQIEV